MADGRPSRSEYDPIYCEQIIEHMKNGDSLESFAAKIGRAKQTIYNWARQFPDFGEALDIARTACEAWWIETGKAMMFMGGEKQPVQPSILIFTMKARFGWRDKPADDKPNDPASSDQDAAQVELQNQMDALVEGGR